MTMANWITDTDYTPVIGAKALEIISQLDAEIRDRAETQAIEEASGYLRPRYAVDKIFADADNRNPQLVMIVADLALYHMSASMPGRMGADVRSERYANAIEWLKGVQKGTILPDLPLATDEDGTTAPTGLWAFGSDKPHNYSW